MRVRAAVLPRTGARLEVDELDLAPPGPGEVLVRLHASGVCHSDLNAIDGTAETRCPAVLGHEGAGVVEAVGPGVALTPGRRVVLSWLPACGRCEECLRDLPHLCGEAWSGMMHGGLLDGTTRLSRGGEPVFHYCYVSTFADRAVVPEGSCIPIPDDVPFEVAALVGCAVATGIGAVWNTARVRPGDRVAVIGCGGVGLSAVIGAASVGASPVVAVDVAEERLQAALEVGATAAVRAGESAEESAAAVIDASSGGVDYAFEATGRADAMLAAFLSTRKRGAAVLIGIAAPDAVVALPAALVPRAERRLLGSAYGSVRPERDFPTILALYRRGRLPLDRLVSHHLPLEEIETAFDLMRERTSRRVVLDLGSPVS
ncbi:MAG: Zn-dependent alcohol dehydrogenase [Thermoleophilia bacterium]|nr:Zn-dependent alcohol dehydrogenase [Thermoleophilia bacterium]